MKEEIVVQEAPIPLRVAQLEKRCLGLELKTSSLEELYLEAFAKLQKQVDERVAKEIRKVNSPYCPHCGKPLYRGQECDNEDY